MSKKIAFAGSLIAGFLILAVIVVVTAMFFSKPVDSQDHSVVKVIITKGASVGSIADKLQEKNLIRHPVVFKIWSRYLNLDKKLQAGTFELSPSMSVKELATQLTQGTNDVWVTLPEGLRREEIAESLATYELPDYDQEEFLSLTMGLEGQLFPETYLLPKMVTTQAVVNLLTQTFEDKTADLQPQIENSEYTFNEILTMASIIEREARGYEQMRQVAGVLYKRLDMGMALQADATLQYATGYNEVMQGWWTPPSAADKEVVSEFNTYLKPGLPPRPICNPGLDAIKASLNPINSGNLYYIHDNKGEIHFARDLQGHNANINQYLR